MNRNWAFVLIVAFVFISAALCLDQPSATATRTNTAAVTSTPNLLLGKLAYRDRILVFNGVEDAVAKANYDGSDRMLLINPPPFTTEPAWSPDGMRIAFVDYRNILVMNADGSNIIQLTNTTSDERNPTWSVANKIAYERDGQIWQMNSDGSGQMQFPGVSQPSPVAPAWSPDGLKLAFASAGDIWMINADGSNEHRATTSGSSNTYPAWSPDGSKIIFSRGTAGLAVLDIAGNSETSFTTGNDTNPAWSQDGTKIAFHRSGTNVAGIYVMDAAGANQIRVFTDAAFRPGDQFDYPTWQPVAQTPNSFAISGRITRVGASLQNVSVNLTGSATASTTTDGFGNYQFDGLPQGGSFTVTPSLTQNIFQPPSRTFSDLQSNRIADFTARETCSGLNCATNGKIAFQRSGEIYTMSSDGSDVRNITNNPAGDARPRYSPDGTKIAFSSSRDGNEEIYTMAPDGSAVVRLTNEPAYDTAPAYSPDGSKIVFTSDRAGYRRIYTMNSDGSDQALLCNGGAVYDSTPSFSPDGSKIIFVRTQPMGGPAELFTVNADGSNQQQLTNVPSFYDHPEYSPDGSKLIFTYGSDVTQQYIWTSNADGTNRALFGVGRTSGSYSPDGQKVVCVNFLTFQNNGIITANAEGSSAVNLTHTDGDDYPDWQPLRPHGGTAFDFDGDGRADISVTRAASPYIWYQLLGPNYTFTQNTFGQPADVVTPADFDGDGVTDLAIFRAPSGDWWYRSSIDGIHRSVHWGAIGDIPLPGDINGDGKADFVVYRNGTWYRLVNGQNTQLNVVFGSAGDKPLMADFDGDGKADPAIFRPSSGTFWYAASSAGGAHRAVQWGISTDVPVPADYDGDGKSDFAVYRPAEGAWYVLQSSNGSLLALQFGVATDRPIPADYDGDGKADIAVYRPSTGIWYLLRTTSGFGGFRWGISTDIPSPAAYIPQ